MYAKASGFTLIELLMVLTLLAILLTLAVPSGRYFLVQNSTMSQTSALVNALYYARHEAIVRNEKLIFCKSADQKKCSGQWRDGQILIDTTGNVLRVFMGLTKGDTLIWNSSGGKDDAIVWLPTGYTEGQHGTFFYCAGSQTRADSRNIVLWNTGRMYVASMSPEDYEVYCK